MTRRAPGLIGLFALFFVVLFHVARMPAAQSAESSALGGTITANGSALGGVTVSARAEGTTVTTTVFTDERGAYSFPMLPGGKYRVWAQAMGYATARAAAVVGEGASGRHDFSLQTINDMSMQASSSEWLAALPSSTKEDRRMRELLRANCTQCHSTAVILQQRFDEKGWLAIIDFMLNGPANAQGGVAAYYDKRSTIEHHREELARYLARVRGPNSPPLKFTPVPRPTGEAAKVVFTEWDLPNANRPDGLQWYDGSDWSEGSTTSGSRGIDIHDVMTDNYGNAWLTSVGSVHSIYRVNTRTGAVSGFSIPGGGASRPRTTHGMDRADDGIIWFDMFGALGRINPATETFDTFTPVKNMSAGPEISTHVDGKGKIWSSTRFGAIRFDPDTKEWTYMQSVRPLDGMSYGNFGDADGNGWWAQFNSDRLGKGDPKSGKSYEVIMRPPWLKDEEDVLTAEDKAFYKSIGALSWGKVNEVPGAQAPRRLGGDKHGEYVWVANFAGNNIARVHIRTLETTYYRPPMMGNPYRVDTDKEGNAWLAMHGDDRLLKLNPKTGQWIVHRMPGNGCEVRHMSVDQRLDEVWVACHRTGKVVRIQYRNPSRTATGLPSVPPATPAASPGEKVTRLDYDMKQVAIPSTLPATALHGRRLFVQRCAACHDPSVNEAGSSYGPKLPGARIKSLGEVALRAKISDGSARMPGFRYMFDKEQMDHLVEYLNTRR
jgi:streptogramin lyase/cytochrome c2